MARTFHPIDLVPWILLLSALIQVAVAWRFAEVRDAWRVFDMSVRATTVHRCE